MKINFLKLIGIVAFTALAHSANAELKWEQTTIELHPKAGEPQAIAHFKYENVGTTPVRFKSVHASCGCTVAQTQKEEVAGGEKGEITATFNIGDRTGQQVKTVTVQTDDPDPSRANTILTLKTTITLPLEIKPTFLLWRSGEEPAPKTILVKAAREFQVRNLTVKPSNADFTAKVEPGKSEGEWKIDVQPKETTRSIATALIIQTDFPKEAPKSFTASAQVIAAPTMMRPVAPAGMRAPPVTGMATPSATPAASGTPQP